MDSLITGLTSADSLKFSIPLIGAIIAWYTNEWRKRLADQYQRKEANYKELIKSLRGFYAEETDAKKLRLEFLYQLNNSWLYCPDEIIQKCYAFLETVHTQNVHSYSSKEKAMGDLVAAIRKDLISRKLVKDTSLTGKDFKHLNAQ